MATPQSWGGTNMRRRTFVAIAGAGFLVATLLGPTGPVGAFWKSKKHPAWKVGYLEP